jgi:TrpR-related protein YerC/YecD
VSKGQNVTIPLAGDDWRTEATDDLFDAVLLLETRDEAAEFFRDLCTYHELDEVSQRWAVVRLLASGLPYRRISVDTGVSTATITRINQWLHHGTGGYRMMLQRVGVELEPS